MAQRAMVIDLQKCVSCGACAFACKTENNTRESNAKATFNWADLATFTTGKFPDTKFVSMPVLCNHCSDAPCVKVCPVTPKAMFKTADGVTMHNQDRCIGCRFCVDACPYSTKDMATTAGALFSVLSYNESPFNPQPFWADTTEAIANCTSSGKEVSNKMGSTPPHRNEYSHPDYKSVRPTGIVEKCIFCDHLVNDGQMPYCAQSCPSGARIVGDKDDPNSEVSKALAKYKSFRLKNNKGEMLADGEAGTQPNVYYIRRFENVVVSTEEKPEISKEMMQDMKIFPNPARGFASLELTVKSPDYLDLNLYDISGKRIRQLVTRQFMVAGKQTLNLDLQGLNSGTYIVHIKLGKVLASRQLVVAD